MGFSNLFASPYFFAYPLPPPFEKLLAHTNGLAARYGTASLRNLRLARHRLPQFFPGTALYQQGNEIAHGALVKPPMHALDNRRNVVVRKFRVLLGKTTLYRIDLRPLFLRHAATIDKELDSR
jgi:hypothetical protein